MAKPPSKPAPRAPRKKPAPAARPYGRSLSDFEPLFTYEMLLMEHSRKGTPAFFNIIPLKDKLANQQQRLRPGFVRFLCLGGDEYAPVHEKGVQMWGGWIEGKLDISDCEKVYPISFFQS